MPSGKSHRQKVNRQDSPPDDKLQPGEKLVADIWGPVATPSLSNFRYLLTVIDPCRVSGWSKVMGLRTKDDATDQFRRVVLGTTIPSPEWKTRPDPGTRDTSESNKTQWDAPEYTPPTADFSPARGILQNHNSGLPPSRRDDATARPPSAAQTATQQATRERAQQPAGL